MTAAIDVGARPAGPAPAFAAAAVACAVVLVAGQEQFRRVEALGSAALVSFLISQAESLGTSVVFPADGRFVGFNVAPGCTAALLIVPFLVVAGVLLLARRVTPRRAVATLAAFAAVVVMINQLRLLVIAASMAHWGYPEGFDRSHILMGSLVSTIGVAGGLLLFIRMVVRPKGRGGHG